MEKVELEDDVYVSFQTSDGEVYSGYVTHSDAAGFWVTCGDVPEEAQYFPFDAVDDLLVIS